MFLFVIYDLIEVLTTKSLNLVVRSSKIVCQAATNVPGDVPAAADSSSGMSTYEKVIETLTTLFPLWVCQINAFITFPSFYCVLNII